LRTFAGHADAVTSVAFSGDARFILSGSADRSLRLWILDWELASKTPADWDEGARPYLEMFLSLHTPFAVLEAERKRTVTERVRSRLFGSTLAEEKPAVTLTRRGQPAWTEKDFQTLLRTLGYAGYGWLKPEGIRRQLNQMVRSWIGLPLPWKG
jgi:hypothetical protein